ERMGLQAYSLCFKAKAHETDRQYLDALESYNSSLMLDAYCDHAVIGRIRILKVLETQERAARDAEIVFPSKVLRFLDKVLNFLTLHEYEEALLLLERSETDANVISKDAALSREGFALQGLGKYRDALECYSRIQSHHGEYLASSVRKMMTEEKKGANAGKWQQT